MGKESQLESGWDGPNDPDNPQEWSLLKKFCHIFPVGLLVLSVTFTSSIISPAASQIEKDFGVSREAAILPFSVYTLGFGFGPAIAAPLSETFGRSAVYKSTAIAYVLFIVGSALTPTFGGLLVCRAFAGIFGGPCVPISGGTAADLYSDRLRADTLSGVMMAGFLGAALGPVVGGFCVDFKGWRWTQWAALILAGVSLLLVLPMHETYKSVILRRRKKKRGIQQDPQSGNKSFARHIVTVILVRPAHMLVTEPIVTAFSLYNSFALGSLYGFFSAYPAVLGKVYNFTDWQTGLTFIGTCIGVLLGWVTAVFIQHKIYLKKWEKAGGAGLPPEQRLYCAMAGSFGIPLGLFWFAWTARPSIHWISPTLAAIPFGWGNICIFITATLYILDCYGPLYGASAMAANGVARYTVAAMFPLFTLQMFERLGVGWAASLLGFISLALFPIPWLFYKYGPKIRARSSYDKFKT